MRTESHTGQVPSASLRTNLEADGDVIALSEALRVVRGGRQWTIEQRGPKTWFGIAFCATKEALILRLKEHLLKEHLLKLDHYYVKEMKAADGKLRRAVSREALEATEAARALLKRGDVSSFGVASEAWAVIEALPDFYPKTA